MVATGMWAVGFRLCEECVLGHHSFSCVLPIVKKLWVIASGI